MLEDHCILHQAKINYIMWHYMPLQALLFQFFRGCHHAWAICWATRVTCTPSSKLGTKISTLGCRSPAMKAAWFCHLWAHDCKVGGCSGLMASGILHWNFVHGWWNAANGRPTICEVWNQSLPVQGVYYCHKHISDFLTASATKDKQLQYGKLCH